MKVEEIRIQEQKVFDEVGCFPYVFGASDGADVIEAIQWVKNNKSLIETTLLAHGAILFRGFPTNDAAAFNAFIEAFDYQNLPYIGGAAPRKQVVGNVYTANEAPPEIDIAFHHEMANAAIWPKKLFFYGDITPESGGETPILLSNEVYKRMLAKHPEFVHKAEKLGIKYTRYLPEENDETSAQGRGWKATYGVETRQELEKKLADRGMEWEWLPNGDVKTITKALPLTQLDERSGRYMWFNSIVAVYIGWNDSRHVGEKCVHFGDGTPLDKNVVISCRDIMNEICVDHKWEHGDVVMIDNRIAMHARRPFVGQRRVYAYLSST